MRLQDKREKLRLSFETLKLELVTIKHDQNMISTCLKKKELVMEIEKMMTEMNDRMDNFDR